MIIDTSSFKMINGFIYCFSNPSMPGILKIGMTMRTPKERLREANVSDTWRPPTPYKIEFAKKINNPSDKENTLHILLEQYTERIHYRREFFYVTPDEVSKLFDLMDGEMWDESYVEDEDEDDDEDEDEDEDEMNPQVKKLNVKGCRDMKKCFTDGQSIRHKIGINKIWIGNYEYSTNEIKFNGKTYKSLSEMSTAHIKVEKPNRKSFNSNGWKECEYEVNGNWISTYSIIV